METLPQADLAWSLAAFGLVMLMFPGLAIYYGGTVGRKNVLNIMLMVFSSLAMTVILYVVFLHGLVLGDSVGGLGLIGNPFDFVGWTSFTTDLGTGGAEDAFWGSFFLLFAAITVAIIASGAVGRMKFSAWLVFVPVWLVLVYAPLAHWVFAISDEEAGTTGGWLRNVIELHDFAGGTAVHMNAGVAALALAWVLGPRKEMDPRPHNIPMLALGGGILWFGWFGFNGGSAGGANFLAQYVFMTTLLAGCAGMIGYMIVEKIRTGSVTAFGTITGMIAGLVGITPSADAVDAIGSIIVGIASGALVAWAVTWKSKWGGIDDSLDAFAVHGVGGLAGTVCVILIGSSAAPAGVTGVLFGGDPSIIWREFVAIAACVVYSFLVTALIAWVMKKTMGIRVSAEVESQGLDEGLHAETAYEK